MSRIENFLKIYSSQSTVRVYRWGLTGFFKTVYGANGNRLEEHGERYFQENRNYEEDIQNFLLTIREKPPKSVRIMLTAVKSFLIENDVELSEKFWRRLRRRIRGNRALTIDKVPSNLELRKILMHMPVHGKAFYLTLASSGLRIGEALQVTVEDLELNEDPAKFSVRGEYTKTGNPRIAFISREAKEAIQEWLKVRSQYLVAAAGKSHTYRKKVEDPRVFPFRDNTAYAVWKNAIKKVGLLKKDKRTNRHSVHPHVLRKFFRTRMAMLIPVDVVEALMGHEGYLTEVYRRYSLEDLAKFYLQGESALLVFTEAEEVGKLRAEVEERNKQLQVLVNGLTAENLEMKSKMAKVELENTNLRKDVAKLSSDNTNLRDDVAELQQGIAKVTRMVEKLVNQN